MKCDRKPFCSFDPSYRNRMGSEYIKGRTHQKHYCEFCDEFVVVKLVPVRRIGKPSDQDKPFKMQDLA